jgi:hypothetical protein
MRATWLLLVMLVVAHANAQQKEIESSVNQKAAALQAERLSSLLSDDKLNDKTDIAIGKKLRIGGPVVRSFKVKKATEVPGRIIKLLNPFAASEAAPAFEQKRNLSTRAWATTIGFHPGGSAFPDATTHESSMTLLTVGR